MRWKALICGEKDDVQAGRIILWISVIALIPYWVMPLFGSTITAPETLVNAFTTLLVYNGYKHARYAYERVSGKITVDPYNKGEQDERSTDG